MTRFSKAQFFGLAAFALALHAGCNRQEEPQPVAETANSSIRGEPIRGKSIRSDNAAPTNTVAAAQASNVATNDSTTNITNTETNIAKAEPLARDGEHLVVGFEKLASFNYEMPDESAGPAPTTPDAKDQIPTDIRALDEKPVAVKGFMLPLKVESGVVTELLLMRDQSMCCFGTVPKINEWVSIKMDKGVKPVMDAPVTIYGQLQVGEMRENGYLVGLYEMAGQKMKE